LAYHAGVLIALEEAGIHFNHIDGTSGGIFGTAMLASGISPKETAIRWRKLDLKGFMAAMPLKDYGAQHNLPALGSASGIRKKIFPGLGIDVQKIKTNTAFQATFNVCNFSKKTVERINGRDVTEDHLVAGMSLPMFMPAIKIGADWYTDAVWIKDANITEAVAYGAEDVWLIWCIGNAHEYQNGTFNQYVHMIEISAYGGVYTEIEWLRYHNADRMVKGLKPVDLHIIKPEYPLPLDPDFLINRINADTLINMGYADTKQYLANSKTFTDDQEVSQSTAMTTVDSTLHFRQQFMGKVMLSGELLPVTIQLSFFIREISGRYTYQLFSSISINGGDFISGHNNIIEVQKAGKLDGEFQFLLNGANHTANIALQLHSVWDMLLGIDNKTAVVNLSTDSVKSPDTVFIQPPLNRIKNAFYTNVNANTSWYIKLKLAYTLLSQLF
jgi:predicted acylesterase/phospholipase RssA